MQDELLLGTAPDPDLPVLAMDLDGTLIYTDTTLELFKLCARVKPFLLPVAGLKMLTNRPHAKRWLVRQVGDLVPRSPDAAFTGFCKNWFKTRGKPS